MLPSTAAFYHQQTKYSPGVPAKGHGMDWDSKPPLHKEYPGAEMLDLQPNLRKQIDWLDQRVVPHGHRPDTFSADALSRLLFYTNGVTAGVHSPGEQGGMTFFRAAPSAGALYPTEVYLVVRRHGPDGPELGTYNYHVRAHTLSRVAPAGFGPEGDDAFDVLSRATHGHPAVAAAGWALVLTTVFQRSAWRYGPRAYRRCMLDTGHVLGNLCAYAPIEGFTPWPLCGFVDAEVNELVGANGDTEAACLVIPLLPARDAQRLDTPRFAGLRSSPVAPAHAPVDDLLLAAINASTMIARRDGALAEVPPRPAPSLSPARAQLQFVPGVKLSGRVPDLRDQLPSTILRRRSTRAFSGAPVRLEDLGQVLEYACRPDLAIEPWETPRLLDPGLLDTWVVAQGIDGLPSGIYAYLPESRELRQSESGDFRRDIYALALEQALAAQAAAVVIHTSNLDLAVRRWGNRAYRMVHLDAGHIGQRINLACIARGLGVSGIGGFYDDQANQLLGLGESDICVYITCIGQPA